MKSSEMGYLPLFRGSSAAKSFIWGIALLSAVNGQAHGVSGGSSTSAPPINKPSYSCSGDHGSTFTGNGVEYELRCDFGAYVGDLYSQPSTTLKECAEYCARESRCSGADWDHRDGGCHIKGPATFPGAASNDYHQWRPKVPRIRGCPDPRQTTEKDSPLIIDYPKCPDNAGDLFSTPDGSYWGLKCCSHQSPGDEITSERGVTIGQAECIQKCSQTDDCQSVVYTTEKYDEGGEPAGLCKLYKSGTFDDTTSCADSTHHYAYMTTGPVQDYPQSFARACATDCPDAHGQVFTSQTGKMFIMSCGKRHGSVVFHQDTRDNLEDCMQACSQMIPCYSVDYHIKSKRCYYGSHQGEPGIVAPGFASAHSLGCAGACGGLCGGKCSV